MTKLLRAVFVCLLVALIVGQLAAQTKPFKSFDDFNNYMKANHSAPWDRDSVRLPKGGSAAVQNAQSHRVPEAATLGPSPFHNVKVNQDKDPWPKAEIAVGVDPTNGNNIVVMSNDFRENYDHMFFHVSTNGGRSWSDDSMVGGNDFFTGFIPLTFQSDPGVGFDSQGHSWLSTITGNLIFDFVNGYENFDTQIEVAQGFAHGTYANLVPIVIDTQQCDGTFTGSFVCDAQLDKPLISVDNVAGSPNFGTVYVYYTLFCNFPASGNCTDGTAVVPPFSSAILESHTGPFGSLPFSAPALVSGGFTQEQFSSLVVDSHGVPHVFFDDFSTGFNINMYMSTLSGGTWTVNPTPVETFIPIGTASGNWFFRINGTIAPGCGINGDIAYCAFSSNQVGSGPFEGGMSAYLAAVDTQSGNTLNTARVNNDPFNDSKDHIFPWASARSSDGAVYVGFYDDRNDPFNTKVEYFVAKSTDGGATFPTQMAVSNRSFNPCIGFPFCGFFGDYTQNAMGPDGVLRTAWSDTRDAASMQIYSQGVTF